MIKWEPWYLCGKRGGACPNCYKCRDFGKDTGETGTIVQTVDFELPLMKSPAGGYRINSQFNPVIVCMLGDFLYEGADKWRAHVWEIIRHRKDLEFKLVTSRPERFEECLPKDWGRGYFNVTAVCRCEDQKSADARLPFLTALTAAHKEIYLLPMLERIDIEKYISDGTTECVSCGGEKGDGARRCDYSWILDARDQCIRNNVSFSFLQTGSSFVRDGRVFEIAEEKQITQAKKADIDFKRKEEKNEEHSFDSILLHLSKSKFRGHFTLPVDMRKYCREKGLDRIRLHAFDFIRARLAPSFIKNDGKQTPMHGHPVFIAQHATATCCRDCLQKWHYIPKGRRLTETEIIYVVDLIMEWIRRDLENYKK